jgi:50S ribosomal subunit-associated GTPase HflX
MYCRGASVAVIVFALSDERSFAELDAWYGQVKAITEDSCAVIVVGNKLDLAPAVSEKAIEDWAAARAVKCIAVSALDGRGIDALFQQIKEALAPGVTPLRSDPSANSEPSRDGCC